MSEHKNADVVTAPSTIPERFSAEIFFRRVTFSWFPPSNLQPTTIIASYILTCTAMEDGVGDVVETFAQAGSYTLGGFRPATMYNCSMFASNSAGDSPLSSISVKTQDERKLSAFNSIIRYTIIL